MEPILNFQVPTEGLELVILLHTLFLIPLKILRIGRVENLSFFWVGYFDFLINEFFFASSLFKSVKIYGILRMGRNFMITLISSKKTRGIWNYEKHCTYTVLSFEAS